MVIRRSLLIVVILFLFLFISIKITSAQIPTIPNSVISAPGINCGNADDPIQNKCCTAKNVSLGVPSTNTLLDSVLGVLNSVANSIGKLLVQPILNIQQLAIKPCYYGLPSTTNINDPNCKCVNSPVPTPSALDSLTRVCQRINSTSEQADCITCINNSGVWTSLGCIYSDLRRFITNVLLGYGISFAGLIAILCIIYSAFQIQTSQGNPEKIKKAQELLTSCITGLILIIFSIFILRLIGVNILKIPFFS